jgi:hypothetical protein
MFFANFIAVRIMLAYGVEIYFYDKLLVAYDIGGRQGLNVELDKIKSGDRSSRQAQLSSDFSARLESGLDDPEAFLRDKVAKNKQTVSFIRDSRSAAISLMLVLFVLQMVLRHLKRQ